MMTSLAYLLACLESDTYDPEDGYRKMSALVHRDQMSNIYDLAKTAKDKSAFLKMVA